MAKARARSGLKLVALVVALLALCALPHPAPAQLTATLEPAWSQLNTTQLNGPSAREAAAMAYNANNGTAVLFGGEGSSGPLGDTWIFNGTSWTQVDTTQTNGPSARSNAAMTFDASTGKVLLFGGMGSTGVLLNDTWTWNETSWTQVDTTQTNGPSARDNASMAFDASNGVVELFGGANYTSNLNDIWAWNGTSWTQVDLGQTNGPSAREGASMAYNPSTNSLVLFGGLGSSITGVLGDTWVWNGTSWTQVDLGQTNGPSAREGASMAYNPSTNSLVLFGGLGSSITGVLGDTWAWNGTNWEQLTPANSPPSRLFASTAFDVAQQQMLIFGGLSSTFTLLDDAWAFQSAGVNLGTANVCPSGIGPSPCSQTGAVTFFFRASDTDISVEVATQGAPGLDFTDLGNGTCDTNGTGHSYNIGDICTVNLQFAPTLANTRLGAVVLNDATGVAATGYVYATGMGPQIAFAPPTQSTQSGAFNFPEGTAVDAADNVYVADTDNNAVKEIPPGCTSSSCVITLGGGFNKPTGAALDGAGNIYIADSGNNAVKETPPGCASSSCVTTLGGGFNNPEGVTEDPNGNVYVADTGDNAVKEMPPGCASSGCVTTLPGDFNNPTGAAVDLVGDVYVADSGDNAVKEIPAGCTSSSCVNSLGGGFDQPNAVALEQIGSLNVVYVADSGNGAVKEMPAGCTSPSCVTTVISGLDDPDGVALDGLGDLLIANTGGNSVVKLSVANPPTVNFPTATAVGEVDSTDGSMGFTVDNIGNMPLVLPVPATGENPSVSAGFEFQQISTCLGSPGATQFEVAVGGSCTVETTFAPTVAGINTGSLVLTDNNLNATNAMQSADLSGTGLAGTSTSVVCPLCTPNPFYGIPLTVTAVVSPAISSEGTPTGSVSFSVDGGAPVSGTPATCPAGSSSDDLCDAFTGIDLLEGAHSIQTTFSPTGNFQGSNNVLDVTVEQAPTSITVEPTASPLTYGQPLASSTLSGGTAVSTVTGASVPGTFAFATPSIVPVLGTSSQSVTFNPLDGIDYAPAPGTVDVTVNPVQVASATVLTAATPSDATHVQANTAYTSGNDSTIIFTATVTGGGVPTGTVDFTDVSNGGSTALNCAGGNPATLSGGTATCQTTISSEGYRSLAAAYSGDIAHFASAGSTAVFTQNHATNTGTTYCNAGAITGGGQSQNSSWSPTGSSENINPYPSVIFVGDGVNTDIEDPVNTVSIQLNNFNVTGDSLGTSLLLVAPDGQNVVFLNSAGGPAGISGNLTFADDGTQVPYEPTDTIGTGTYEPTAWLKTGNIFTPAPPLPAPQAPATISQAEPAGSATFLSTFGGATAHGVWSLFVYNNEGSDVSSSLNGWCVDISPATGTPTTTTVSASVGGNTTQNALKGATVQLDANVSSSETVSEGTVTFFDTPLGTGSATEIGTASVLNGTASLDTSSLIEGDHKITVQYADSSGTFNASSGTILFREDQATSTPTLSGTTWSYCNPAGITIPASPAPNDTGAASPNPSNIFVRNLPGTISDATVTLDNLKVEILNQVDSLLVGPNGGSAPTTAQTFDFFSGLASGSPFGPESITFGDSGSTLSCTSSDAVPATNSQSASCTTATSYTASPFYTLPDSFQHAQTAGGFTFNTGPYDAGIGGGVYQNTNPNGTWSLYFNQTQAGTGSGATGWCMNFTENPVTVEDNRSYSGSGGSSTFEQAQQGSISIEISVSEQTGNGPTGDPNGTNPLTVTDTLPTGFTAGPLPTGTPWNCSGSTTIKCTNDSPVSPGSSYPLLSIPVNVSASAVSGSNAVNVAGAGVTTINNSDSVIVAPSPVLSVAKSHSGTFTQGQTAQWNITVSNTASAGTTSGTTNVSDTLPAGYSLSTSSGSGWSCAGATTVSCNSTQAVAGGSSFPTLVLTVNVTAASPTSVSNTASAWGGGDQTHASSGTAAVSNTDTVTVVQVPASISINGMQTQSESILSPFGSVAVTLLDANSVAIPNYSPVVFTATTGSTGASGTFSNSSNTISISTNGSGVAAPGTFTANAEAGSYSLGVTAGSASVTFSLTNLAGLPASIAATSGSGQSATVDMQFANSLVVTVLDAHGNPAPNITVTFNAPSQSGASATLSNSGSCMTLPTGSCGVTATANGTTGSYDVTAAISGYASVGSVSFALTNSPAPAYVVATLTDDANGAAGNCVNQNTGESSSGGTVNGDCTLRDGITAANAAGGGTITFAPGLTGTITLGSALPNLSVPAIITGPGANVVSISGNNSSTVGTMLTVNSGVTVTISGLTFANANSPANGGVINNSGNLTLDSDTFSNSTASYNGGAVYSSGGSMTVNDCAFVSNQSRNGNGGAISISGSATMVVEFSTYWENIALGGGAIDAQGSSATVADSTFFGNTATEGDGGAVLISGPATVTNNIFNGNQANEGAGVSGPANLSFNLFYADLDNQNGGSGLEDNCNGCASNSNAVSGNPNLAELGNYGGQTQTMLPLPPSAAIGAGSYALILSGVTTDQRGDPNENTTYTGSPIVDIGAVQTNYSFSFTTDPPSTGTTAGTAMSPAPVVTVYESGSALTAGSVSVSVTDANSDLTTSPATASTSATDGQAIFGGLIFTHATDDTFTATLSLNPSLTTPLSITTQSTGFTVGTAMPAVTWPTATAISYGQPLSDSALSGGSAMFNSTTVTGMFAFTTPTLVPLAGTQMESVTFTPSNTNEFSSVSSNVSVLVNKAPTEVSVLPTASPITVGQTLASSTLSGGTAISTVSGATVPGTFTFTSPSTAPTATGPQSVTFTPTDTSDYLGTTTSVTVTVTTATAPVAKISPSSINFGTPYLGQIVTKTVTITNTGNAAMTISAPLIANVEGGNSDEYVTANLCPKSLAAGKSCTMTVTFIAGPFYTAQTATLLIYDNAVGSPQQVLLSATVIDPVAQFSPSSLSFGTVKTGTSSGAKTITLTSAGGTALSITNIKIVGANPGDFSETSTCPQSPATLAPKGKCGISVIFKPTVKGLRSATLEATDNAQNSPQLIPLLGTGD